MKNTEELSKMVENLKSEKLTLTNGVFKLKKIIEDLKKKNFAKSEALKSIRNFFLTSTLFKVKNIGDFEEQERDQTPIESDPYKNNKNSNQ